MFEREDRQDQHHGRPPLHGRDRPAGAGFEPVLPAGDGHHWKPLIDPLKVIEGILTSKKWIVAMTVAGALLGVAVALSTPKKYEAVTELIADPRNLQITGHDLTQSGISSDTALAIVENQVRVLTSGTVLNEVATKLNLADDPEFNGQGQGFPGVMELVRSVLSRDDAPGAGGEERQRAIVVRSLAESLTVARDSKTFVVSIGVKTENGEKSALIANTMADVFRQTYAQMQSETAGRATDELTARLDELRKGVETAEHDLETFKAEHDLVDAQGRLISDDELLKLNDQLTVARARTLELNAKAASARALDVDSVVAGTLPEEISSDAMNDLRSQYAKLKQEADRADVKLGPRHPERIAIEAQLSGARGRIATELRRIASSLQTDLKRAVQLEQQLSARLAQLKVRSGDINKDLVTAHELERVANAKRAVYESFLLGAKQTGEQKYINTANISIISKAYPPLDPTGPSRAMTSLLGLLLGFASGIGLGAMRGAYASLREAAAWRSARAAAVRREVPAEPSSPPEPEPEGSAEPEADAAAATAAEPAEVSPVAALQAAISNTLHQAPGQEPDGEVFAEEAYEEEARAGGEAAAPFAAPPFDAPPFAAEERAPRPEAPLYRPYPYSPQRPAYPYAYPQEEARAEHAPGAFSEPDEAIASIEEIRASLREFREAVRELTESRSRRRYF